MAGVFHNILVVMVALQAFTVESRLLPSIVQTIRAAINTREISRPAFCEKLNGLPESQRAFCRKHTAFLPAIGMGADLAMKECRMRFQYDRWNCILDDNRFRHLATFESRETSFVDSMISAGVMMAISRTCSKGNLTKYCRCDKSVLNDDSNEGNFEWGSCGDDFQKGDRWSRQFLDLSARDYPAAPSTATAAQDGARNTTTAPLPAVSVSNLVHKWNNRRGRLAVRNALVTVCKCHGLCGACTVKICWKEVPSVNKIGQVLKESYRDAKPVRLAYPQSPALIPVGVDVTRLSESRTPFLTPSELVYLKESPDFCMANESIGIPGTAQRRCRVDSSGEDGCEILCCGHGYYETREVLSEQCRCKFVWCCDVKCGWCDKVYQSFHCKTPRPAITRS